MRRQTRRTLRRHANVDWFACAFGAGCAMFFFLAVYLIQLMQVAP